MRKNYFLSLLLLMIAFWNVEAKEREISKTNAPTSNTMVLPLLTPTEFDGQPVTNVLGTRINLVWRDNTTGETGFEVAYSTNGTVYNFISVPGENVPLYKVFTLTGLNPDTKYWLAVRAVKTGAGPTDPGCTAIPGETNGPTTLYSCWSPIITKTTSPTVPNPPTNLQVLDGDIKQTTAKLSFTDDSNNESDFLIQKRIGLGAWEDVATIPGAPGTGTRLEYTVTGLFSATVYQFRVFSHNVTDWSSVPSNIKQIETLPFPPGGPSELISPWQTLNKIRLEWTINSINQDVFVIERSTNGGPFIVIANDWFKYINFFEDEGVQEGVCYAYRIKARNKGGDSPYTNTLNVCTKKRVPPPAPYDLQAKTVSTKRIDLNWSNQMFGEYNIPVSIEIYRSTNGVDYNQIAILTPEQYTYSDTTGKPKTKYWYKILSANYFGQSAYSNVATATTLGPPSMPTDLQVVSTKDSLGNDILRARWTDTSDDEDYFVLDRATDVNFTMNVLTTNLVKNYTSATSIPFDEGVTYYFRIRAVNVHGSSDYTTWTSVTSFYTAIPNMPYGLKATAAAGAVTLKWGDDSNKEEGFEIERSTDGTNFGKVTTTDRNATSYVDNTVAANTKYWYRVRAVNPKGASAFTNVVEVSTPAAANAFVGGANQISNDAWQVYPNPTADAVKVTLPESMQNQAGIVTIIDRMNREVIKMKLNGNQTEYQFDLSNFSEGTYTISIRTGTQQISKRVYKY
jgi:titin